jgi:hypothetical protein
LGGYSYSNISGDKNENSRVWVIIGLLKLMILLVIYYGKKLVETVLII